MKGKDIKIIGIITMLVMLSLAVAVSGCTTQQSATVTPTAAASTTAQAQNQSRVIVDFTGASVTIPANVTRITSVHPIPTQLLYVLAPQDMTSVDSVFTGEFNNYTWTPSALAYMKSLPVIPSFPMNPTKEQVLSTNPQVILTLQKDPHLATWLSLGIPVIQLSKNNLTDYIADIRIMGELTGNTNQADQMETFWENIVSNVTTQTSQISTHPKVLYYNGAYNSTTVNIPGPDSVFGSEIQLAGGINFYNNTDPQANVVPTGQASSSEGIPTDISYINAWNPDVIICTSNATASYILAPDSPYRDMNAVQNGRVYTVRKYETMDGVTSIMGFEWLATVMYPGQLHLDFVNDSRTYFQLFQNDGNVSTSIINTPSP